MSLAAAGAIGLIQNQMAKAADGTWTASSAGNWSNTTDWMNATVPGGNGTLTNTDTATFNTATGVAVTIDLTAQNIGNITFASGAGAFTIGGGAANTGNSLLLSSGGVVTDSLTAATNETFNAPLVLEPASSSAAGSCTFTNNNSNNSGLLNFAGNITGGTTSGAVTLTLGGNNTGTNLISGIIGNGGATGKLGIIKTGSGTWELGAANTFSGGITLSQGSLILNNNTSGGSGPITLGDGNTGSSNIALTLNNSSNAAPYTNATTVSASGNGTVTIVGTNANGEANGNLVLNRPTTLSANFSGGGGFYYNFSGAGSISGNVSTLTLTAPGTGFLYMGGTNTFLGTVAIPTGTIWSFNAASFGTTNPLVMSGTSQLGLYGANLTISALTGASGNTVNTSVSGNHILTIAGSSSTTFAGVISGGGGVTIAGTGTQSFSGLTNSYTGATTISGGVLNAAALANGSSNSSIGASSNAAANLVLNGGTLQYTGTTAASTNRNYTLGTSGGSFDASGTGTLTISGNMTASGSSGSQTLTLTGNGTGAIGGGTLSGTINNGTSTNTTAVLKTGNGTWTLSGANTYSAATTISAGTLQAGVASATVSGAFGNNSAVILANVAGATLDLNGFNTQIGSLAGGGATGGNVTLGNATLTTGGDNTSPAAFAGAISGAGGITKIGSGIQIVSGANSYSGATTISGGTLQFAGPGSLYNGNSTSWSAANIIVSSGATISLNVGGASDFSTGNVTTLLTNLDGAVSSNGLTAGSSIGFDTTNASSGVSLSSAIANTTGTGGGAVGVTKFGPNTLNLSGASTYSGPTTVNAGTLQAGIASGAGSGAFGNNSAVALANVAGAMLDLNGFNTQIGSLTGGGATGGNVTLGNATLTTGGDNTSPAAYAGVISGTGGVTKIGSGTQSFSGANTYTGPTIISSGVLNAATLANINIASSIGKGSSGGSAADLVLNGGTLQYTGNTAASTNRAYTLGTGGGSFDDSGNISGTMTIGGNMLASGSSGSQTLTLTGSSGNATTGGGTLTGTVSNGTGNNTTALLKTGTGAWTLTNANSFSGGTTIELGTLTSNNSSAAALGTGNITLGDANTGSGNVTLNLNYGGGGFSNTSPNITVANQGSGTDTIAFGSQNDAYDKGTITLNRSATITTAAASGGSYLIATGGVVTGNLNGGTLTLQSTGGGALYIGNSGAANTFVGTVSIPQGTVTEQGGDPGALGTTNPVIMSGTATLNLSSHLLTTADITGASGNTISLGSGTLTISSANSATYAGTISGSSGNIIKGGSGTEIFSGSNSYTGTTTISAGALRANNGTNGSATGTGNITVAASTASAGNSTTWYTGGTFGGNGTVSGTVTLTASSVGPKLGGIIAAGSSGNATTGIGTLTTGNETWGQGSAYQWKINNPGASTTLGNTTIVSGTAGTGYDFLKIGGNLTSGSLLSVLPTGSTAFTIDPIGNITVTTGATYNWTIAQIGSGAATQIAISGNTTSASTTPLNSSIFALDTSNLTINGSNSSYLSNAGNFGLYFETVGGNNDLVLSYNSTPEPGTTLLVLGGVAPILMGRRRRRTAAKS